MNGFGGEVPAVQTRGLGKRFGSKWALQDCNVLVPQGRVVGLVGPNGAGKTTLLRLLVGLSKPTTGDALVLDRHPQQNTDFLASIGYLAQETPLYSRLTADDHLQLGAHMNPRWDDGAGRERLTRLRIPLDRPVGTLSGGQRAQVALSLSLAKQPRLLALDEPVAALDPLARREFLSSLTESVADTGLTVILSSHLLPELERVCDHLILLSEARTQLCGDIDDVLASHKVLVGPLNARPDVARRFTVIKQTRTSRNVRYLVRANGKVAAEPPWEIADIGLEEIILAYMGYEHTVDAGPVSLVGGQR
jgi:ABC-2 type transport system ATP-binding protein